MIVEVKDDGGTWNLELGSPNTGTCDGEFPASEAHTRLASELESTAGWKPTPLTKRLANVPFSLRAVSTLPVHRLGSRLTLSAVPTGADGPSVPQISPSAGRHLSRVFGQARGGRDGRRDARRDARRDGGRDARRDARRDGGLGVSLSLS
jgi:hypothetical protein